MNQQTINIQNLYQMYQANPHSANDKYAALDNIGGMAAPNNNSMGMGGMNQGMGGMNAGMGGMNQGMGGMNQGMGGMN